MEWMRELAAAIGRPVTFALTQNDHDPESWARMLELCAQAAADGAPVTPQVAGRPVTLLLGLQTFHPFAYCPSFAAIGGAPRAEKVAALRNPEMRRRLLSEVDAAIEPMKQFLDPERAFPFGDAPDYEPAREQSVAGLARAQGRTPMEVFYDVLLEDDGRKFVMRPLLNYTGFSPRPGTRDAREPRHRVGSRRRRRALRHHVRREHADVHAHALDPRPVARPAARSSSSSTR